MKVHFQASGSDMTLCGRDASTLDTTADVMDVECRTCVLSLTARKHEGHFVIGGAAYCCRCGEYQDLRQDDNGVWWCCLCSELMKDLCYN